MRTILQNIGRAALGGAAGIVGLVLALPALALLLPVWWIDFLVRAFRRLLEPRPVPWEELIEFAPEVGWKPKPHLSAHALDFNQEAYFVTTDDSGWRGGGTVEDADVVVFGDSYAFGCGVDDGAFFADLPDDVQIKAIGSPAYSLVHSLMWMERMAPRLAGKLVVWFVYHGNDLADNVHPAFNRYRSPFVRPVAGGDGWELVSEHVDASPWTINEREGGMEAFIEICTPGEHSKRAFAACDYLIRRGADVCRRAGARLVVLSIPDLSPLARLALERALDRKDASERFDPDTPDRELARICERIGVPFVPLEDHLDAEDYLERDFHWSPKGHRKVARLLESLMRAEGSSGEMAPPVASREARPRTASAV